MTCASARGRCARTSRGAIVETGTRKPRATAQSVGTPGTRGRSATRGSGSMRQIASIARCASEAAVSRRPELAGASPVPGPMARAPSHPLVIDDLTDLERPTIVGCPLQPLEGLVDRAHLPQPVAGHELLSLRE